MADAQRTKSGSEKIHAPFTREQVAALNDWQRCGWVHAFTCENRASHVGEGELVATLTGWICPQCTYTQDWAHSLMLTLPPNPLDAFRKAT